MAYEAKRNDSGSQQPQTQDERNVQNNANNIRNAADVAMATKNPYAMAAGAIVKGADKLTGGKSTEMLGKALNTANKVTPGGKMAQNSLNKMSESGMADKVGKAASMYNSAQGNGTGGANGAGGAAAGANGADQASKAMNGASGQQPNQASKSGFNTDDLPNLNKKSGNEGPAQPAAELSEEDEYKTFGDRMRDLSGGLMPGGSGLLGGAKKPSSFLDDDQSSGGEENPADFNATFKFNFDIKKVLIISLPIVFFFLLFTAIIGAVGGGVADFDDALGASSISGGQTGDIVFEPTSRDAKKFYERINDVKLEMQQEGKTVDVLKVAAVYHVLNITNNKYDYDYMTKSRIREIADAMFNGTAYSEEIFRENLTNVIFKKYFPDYDEVDRETLTDEVFDYIERYFSFIGEEMPLEATCGTSGSCSYNIKGFYIPGRGNVVSQMNVSNLQVRLMECGSPYGNGSYNTPIPQATVPFEDYVAGVAYAEIGASAPVEAIKAQMVVARSYALARPTAMGNSNGKKLAQENGQWILQISSCVADQVFCNINEGCSWLGGGDGQGGICVSGIKSNAVRTRAPLAQNHVLRTAASATAGEVLVNDQGYIIEAGYLQTEQNKFTQYANQGMNYKQILLQVYNSSPRAYHAADISKMSCQSSTNTINCGSASTGPYASWKQYSGPWTNVPMGRSGRTVRQIGCLVTSISMLIAKSGVPTVIPNFNPGTFVQHLNSHGGFDGHGNFQWASVSTAAPTFKWVNKISVAGYTKQQKLNKIVELLNQGYYVVAEVKGVTGQHWVAIDAVHGSTIIMMDPGSSSTDMWSKYNWINTSTLSYFKVG